jgi:hypothetical protein
MSGCARLLAGHQIHCEQSGADELANMEWLATEEQKAKTAAEVK